MSMTRSPAEPVSEPRRKFLGWLARGFLSLWALGLAWASLAFLRAPRSRGSVSERVIKVGPLEALPVGGAQLVRRGTDPVWVVRPDADTLVGLSGVCTHLRCILTWDGAEKLLRCPCHQGAFDLNGNVLTGPPPRPLKTYRVDAQLGEVYVHL